MPKRRSRLLVALVRVGVALLAPSIAVGALVPQAGATTKRVPPEFVYTSLSRLSLPSQGGVVQLGAYVSGATRCLLRVVRPEAVSVTLYSPDRPCASGTFETSVRLGPNATQHRTRVVLRLTALGEGKRTTRRVVLIERPDPLPLSGNWAGYVVPSLMERDTTAPSFTSVSGEFTVPFVTCTAVANGVASVWTGLRRRVRHCRRPFADGDRLGVLERELGVSSMVGAHPNLRPGGHGLLVVPVVSRRLRRRFGHATVRAANGRRESTTSRPASPG